MKTLVPLAEHGALARRLAGGDVEPVELVDVCACGAKLRRPKPPSLAWCDGCIAAEGQAERRHNAKQGIAEWYRWADLERPLIPPGEKTPVVPDDARWRARAWLEGRKRVLTIASRDAATGAGKTTLAAAVANGAADRGESPVWVLATDLSPMRDRDRAERLHRQIVRSRFAVVDGLGKELGTAGAGKAEGVAAQRVELVVALIQELYALGDDGPRMVWVPDMTGKAIIENYGGDALRRLIEPSYAEVIVLQSTPRAFKDTF